MSIKLKAGDHVSTTGMTEDQYRAVAAEFLYAGCPVCEFPRDEERGEGWYFGWGTYIVHGLAHSKLNYTDPGSFFKNGRQLTIEQVLGTRFQQPQEEPSQMTIESLLKLAREYAEEAAESQRKSEELYEQADKMFKELRGGAGEQVVEEDMSDPSNWRARDVVEWLGGVVAPDLTVGGLYIVQAHDGDGRPYLGGSRVAVLDDAGDLHERNAKLFNWVNRPSKETK